MGNSGCTMCPGSRRSSYVPILSDEETISATGAWIEESLSKAKHAERLRIKEEVLDELLAMRQADKEMEMHTEYGNYSPPDLHTLDWNNERAVTRTSRLIQAIPTTTDDQEMSAAGSEPTFDNELLERRVMVSSMDHSLHDMEDLPDFSESPTMARDYIKQAVDQDFDENVRMGCESLILNYDTEPGRGNTDGLPVSYDSVLDKWGFDDSDDSQLFQQASPKSRKRSCLTIAEMRQSRDRMLQAEENHDLCTDVLIQDDEQHEEEMGTWRRQEVNMSLTEHSPRTFVL